MRNLKIAILNQPLNNRGDQAAHTAFINQISNNRPNDSINVIFINENTDDIKKIQIAKPENVNYINITGLEKASNKFLKLTLQKNIYLFTYAHPLLRKFVKTIRNYDLIICAPGGICMGGFMNWKHIWQLEVCKHLDKRVFYWGRSVGPFDDSNKTHSIFKNKSENLINYFEYISLRDNVSYNLVKK